MVWNCPIGPVFRKEGRVTGAGILPAKATFRNQAKKKQGMKPCYAGVA